MSFQLVDFNSYLLILYTAALGQKRPLISLAADQLLSAKADVD
jgi:hypothetical protein